MIETMDGEANGNQAVFALLASGTVKQVKAALAVVDPLAWKDEHGNTLLHMAISNGARPWVTKTIIETVGQVDVPNDNGETPLALAAAGGITKTVEMLLAAGANINAQDRQCRTALMKASDSGHTGMVAMLIKHEADVNAADKHQETALMMASAWGHHKVVQALVRGGAACDLPNKDGWTAMNFAEDLGNTEVVKIFDKLSKRAPTRASVPKQPQCSRPAALGPVLGMVSTG